MSITKLGDAKQFREEASRYFLASIRDRRVAIRASTVSGPVNEDAASASRARTVTVPEAFSCQGHNGAGGRVPSRRPPR